MKKLETLEFLMDQEDFEDVLHGDSKHGNIEKDGYFYHVTQQCWNHRNFYGFDSAKYRDDLLKSSCKTNHVVPIMSIILPNHSHDVFYSKDVLNIQKVFQITNSKVSKFIVNERKSLFNKETPRVFNQRPTYTMIRTREQLFYLFYYLYHNGDYLTDEGKGIPYSCFEMWEKGNVKNYNLQLFEALFFLKTEEIIKMCKELSKEEFRKYGEKNYRKFSDKDSRLFLKN